jgi:hypothetical protein
MDAAGEACLEVAGEEAGCVAASGVVAGLLAPRHRRKKERILIKR